MWRTPPPLQLQTVFWGPYSPRRTACLFSYGKKYIYISEFVLLPHLINIKFLSLNFSAPLTSRYLKHVFRAVCAPRCTFLLAVLTHVTNFRQESSPPPPPPPPPPLLPPPPPPLPPFFFPFLFFLTSSPTRCLSAIFLLPLLLLLPFFFLLSQEACERERAQSRRDSKLFRTSSQIYPRGFPHVYFGFSWGTTYLRENQTARSGCFPSGGSSAPAQGKNRKAFFFGGGGMELRIGEHLPRVPDRTGEIITHFFLLFVCFLFPSSVSILQCMWKQQFGSRFRHNGKAPQQPVAIFFFFLISL